MARRRAEQIRLIRDRLIERAAANSPVWTAPVAPAARLTANSLLIGCLLQRLPDEDASALTNSILEEQNTNGSWSGRAGDDGDISVTLEVLEALSVSRRPEARPALNRAVDWLEQNKAASNLNWQTLLLIGAVNESTRYRWTRRLGRIKQALTSHVRPSNEPGESSSLRRACSILAMNKLQAINKYRKLLELQHTDGSWDGLVRTTVLALAALRHAGLPISDSAMDRGWRFLRAHQHWSTYGLVQNPSDFSTVMHAVAVRSLVGMGASPNALAGSVLTLLHAQRTSGGWGLGAHLPTDVLTTSLVMRALSLVGDDPIETEWARRRGGMLLISAQHRDGGWPLYLAGVQGLVVKRSLLPARGLTDVTSAALLGLVGDNPQPGERRALIKGVKFLTRRQRSDGSWQSDLAGNDIFSTARALQALAIIDPDGSRKAILNGVKVLRDRQMPDGGWGLYGKSTPAETAWAVRALQSVPGLYKHAIARARAYLMRELDESGLVWYSPRATFPLPYEGDPVDLWDLTTIWALEAFSPAPKRAPRKALRRSRSLFDRRT